MADRSLNLDDYNAGGSPRSEGTDSMSRLSKIVQTLVNLIGDSNTCHQRILLLGTTESGKTRFRETLFQQLGDERSHIRFHEYDRRCSRMDGVARTCIKLEDRESIDICYKRFELSDYEWTEKRVKVHLIEPDKELRQEKDVLAFIKQIDSVAIFVDATSPSLGTAVGHHGWLPYNQYIPNFPPLVIVYNKKTDIHTQHEEPFDKFKVREAIDYEKLIRDSDYQTLEIEIDNVNNKDSRNAVLKALLQQGSLPRIAKLQQPSSKVFLQE